MPNRLRQKYSAILKREFSKALGERGKQKDCDVTVRFHQDETIHVYVGPRGTKREHLVMEIGSDDDEFHFYNIKDTKKIYTLRFPFPQDWLDLLSTPWN